MWFVGGLFWGGGCLKGSVMKFGILQGIIHQNRGVSSAFISHNYHIRVFWKISYFSLICEKEWLEVAGDGQKIWTSIPLTPIEREKRDAFEHSSGHLVWCFCDTRDRSDLYRRSANIGRTMGQHCANVWGEFLMLTCRLSEIILNLILANTRCWTNGVLIIRCIY